MVARILTVLALFGLGLAAAADAQPRRQPPYFASISASRAMMRTGPGRTYPGIWLYVRPDLPVRVVEVYQNWRKVEDPDGTQGWMLVNLLSDTRTAIVRGGAPVPMRAAPGVVGRISRCGRGWCRFDVHGKAGYIRTSALWGVGADEEVD
jgi:SH3-like domain-containing protein